MSSSKVSGTVNTYNNGATYSQDTSYTPSYGIIGSSTQVRTKVLFARYLVLSGFDLEIFKKTKQVQDAHEIWSTKVNSVGESGDLRKLFPILLFVAHDYLAENTGKKVSHSIRNDENLMEKIDLLTK